MTKNRGKTIRKISLILVAVVVVSMLAFTGAGAAVKITYNANGGIIGDPSPIPEATIADADGVAIIGGDMTNLSNKLTLSEKVFVGWNTQADGGGTNYMPGERVVITTDLPLYAQWGQIIPVYNNTDLANVFKTSSGTNVTVKDKDGNDVTFTCADFDCVRLMVDIASTSSFNANRNIVFDLNGWHLSSTNKCLFSIAKIKVTIMDSNPTRKTIQGYLDPNGVWKSGECPEGEEYTDYDISGGLITSGYTGSRTTYWDSAICILESGKSLVIEGGTIAGIDSQTMGAVFSLGGGGDFTMNGGAIVGNRTTNSCGGTVINDKGGVVTISNGLFESNVCVDTSGTNCCGGGVIRVDGSSISNTINIFGGTFKNNKVVGCTSGTNHPAAGGAIYIWGQYAGGYKETINIKGEVVFEGNTAPLGGAIAMVSDPNFNGTFEININGKIGDVPGNVVISSNKATTIENKEEKTGYGGAIYMGQINPKNNPKMIISLDGVKIAENSAEVKGGAIMMNTTKVSTDSGMTINDSTISGNKVVIVVDEVETLSGNGGAIYLANGVLNIGGTTLISGNKAINGGCFYIEDGTLTTNDTVTVSGNEAKENGGGIYLGGGTMTMNGITNILLNTADNGNGGGVYVGDGSISVSADTTIQDNTTNIENNTAKDKGAGVYQEAGKFSMGGNTFISDNTLTNTATGQGSGYYLKDATEVIFAGKAKFGPYDELYIESLENCGEGIGIQANNWTGEIMKLGLNQTQFEGNNVVVFTVNDESAGDLIKRVYLSDDERWALKNVYIVDPQTGEEEVKTDKVYAYLNYPTVVDATFNKIEKGEETGKGTLYIAFVISEANTANWYKVKLYYSDSGTTGTWTEVYTSSAKEYMYDESGKKTTIAKRGNYEIPGIVFDGTTRTLQNGYYGIEIEVGKDAVSTDNGKVTPILNRLHYVSYIPTIITQPKYFYGITEGAEDMKQMVVEAKGYAEGVEVNYQWQYCSTGKPTDFYDLSGEWAKKNAIYPTDDGTIKGKVMPGYYRCKVSNKFTTANTNEEQVAEVITTVTQVAVQYDITYINGKTGSVLDLEPKKYDSSELVDLPDEDSVEAQVPGHLFYGWYLTDELKEEDRVTKIRIGSEGAKTFYGKIDLIPYEITLDLNGKGKWDDGVGPTEKIYAHVTDKVIQGVDGHTPVPTGSRAAMTTIDGWSIDSSRKSTVVMNLDGSLIENVDGYTNNKGEWIRAEDTTLYAHWVWPDPVVYLESLGGQPIELSKVKVEVTNEAGEKFVYKSPKNDTTVGDFLEAGEKLNLAYGVDPINGYFPEYDGWGVGHGEKVRVHVIYNNEHTLYDQEVIAI